MNINQYQFFNLLTQQPSIDEIWLYGSRASGDFQKNSDIDLAIIAPKATNHDWQNILTIINNADTLLKIDCVRFDTIIDKKFKNNILQDKVVIFKKHMNQQEKINLKIEVLERAISQLNESVQAGIDEHRFLIDSTIQRFEFSFELFWKTLKYILKEQGIETQFPKEALQTAHFGSKKFQHKLKLIKYQTQSPIHIFLNWIIIGIPMKIYQQKM